MTLGGERAAVQTPFITDIMFFVNGIPVIVSETKAATKTEGIAEAFDDIRYYHQYGPELLAISQLHALTHLVHFYYGATWNLSRKWLFNWRDEQAGGAAEDPHRDRDTAQWLRCADLLLHVPRRADARPRPAAGHRACEP